MEDVRTLLQAPFLWWLETRYGLAVQDAQEYLQDHERWQEFYELMQEAAAEKEGEAVNICRIAYNFESYHQALIDAMDMARRQRAEEERSERDEATAQRFIKDKSTEIAEQVDRLRRYRT